MASVLLISTAATGRVGSSGPVRRRDIEHFDQVTRTLFGWWLHRDSNPRVGLERADSASQGVDVLRWLYRWLFRIIAWLNQSSSVLECESMVGR
jgi:hypothetical protein